MRIKAHSRPASNDGLPTVNKQGSNDEMLELLERDTFQYFIQESNSKTGLIADSTAPKSPSSIAVNGLALSVFIAGIERGFISRSEAVKRTLKILRFFDQSRQSPRGNSSGYKGFYYHFLDMRTGERACQSELSTIDTALLCAGMLNSAQYFTNEDSREKEIRSLADKLYFRVDWQWACNKKSTLTHGWKPGTGFLRDRWDKNYSEALILYVLALGSPSFPISEKGYREWTSTFKLSKHYGVKYLAAGPLFIHQLAQVWLDLRGSRDDFTRKAGFDYFENSRRATCVQREYAIKNPKKFSRYSGKFWGLTASAGPGPATLEIDGKKRVFHDYIARGAPHDIDDGTVSPWAALTSLPFSPEIVLKTVRHGIEKFDLKNTENPYGMVASFNPSFPSNSDNPHGWISPYKYGLNLGPLILMIENHQRELIWKLMAGSPYISTGLKRAGFRKTNPTR